MILITSGCSFSETISDFIDTWPRHLAKHSVFNKHVSVAMGSQGNGLIARKILYAVHQQLKTNKPEDLLVGIMWSGPNRGELYVNEKITFDTNTDGWMTNPLTFVDNDPGSWIITNMFWTNKYAKRFYKHYDEIYGQIQTLEHIIRVQNYLKLNNIKYFMTPYTDEVLVHRDHPATAWLYEQIDFDQFLTTTGCFEWCKKNTSIPFCPDGFHPSTEQHKIFTDQMILPWIKKKYNI